MLPKNSERLAAIERSIVPPGMKWTVFTLSLPTMSRTCASRWPFRSIVRRGSDRR
jgi:hypothetical protein